MIVCTAFHILRNHVQKGVTADRPGQQHTPPAENSGHDPKTAGGRNHLRPLSQSDRKRKSAARRRHFKTACATAEHGSGNADGHPGRQEGGTVSGTGGTGPNRLKLRGTRLFRKDDPIPSCLGAHRRGSRYAGPDRTVGAQPFGTPKPPRTVRKIAGTI